jgi:hypothetical protein
LKKIAKVGHGIILACGRYLGMEKEGIGETKKPEGIPRAFLKTNFFKIRAK